MTPEQYYWFVRRQQMLKAWNAFGAGSVHHRFFHFDKTENPYLFRYDSDEDYEHKYTATLD